MGKYKEKVNNTSKQKKIKKKLEELGHTNVEVWWDKLQPACEMCGMGGGYIFCSDQEQIYPIGYSLEDALYEIENHKWLDKRKI
jgi:hypothetical protein